MNKFMEQAISGIIVWVLCFVSVSLTLPVVTLLFIAFTTGQATTGLEAVAPAYVHTVLSPFPSSPYWLAVLGLGATTATVLPWRRQRLRMRRSASLRAVHEASRMPAIEPGAVDCIGAVVDPIIAADQHTQRGGSPERQ